MLAEALVSDRVHLTVAEKPHESKVPAICGRALPPCGEAVAARYPVTRVNLDWI